MSRLIIKRLSLIAVLLFMTTAAFGQATRTWVSGVGDDANPCSRTAPCKTFAGAISKTAAGGEINVLDPGGFGAVTITKSITIDGNGTFASILAAGTNGVNINAGASDTIVLKNLSINGALFTTSPGVRGVRVISAGKVVIYNCEIFGFSDRGVSVESSNAVQVEIINSRIHHATSGVLAFPPSGTPASSIVINRCDVVENTNRGVYVANGGVMTVSNSNVSHNGTGVVCENSAGSTTMNVAYSTIASNTTGLSTQTGCTLRIGTNVIVNNTSAAWNLAAGTGFTYTNNQVAGNGGGTVGTVTGIGPQ